MYDLMSLARSATSVYSIATGGAFAAALDSIGAVEVKAAKDAFSKVDQSAQPKEALNRTLTHLETAHVALRTSWSSGISKFTRGLKANNQAILDARACCCIAAIHHALGDDKNLVKKALKDSEEATAFVDNSSKFV